jgi:hypothetical protein
LGDKLYYLMDLERTLVSGIPCYWKENKYGYTYNLKYAGLFNEDLANEIVKNDLDERTVKVSQKVAVKYLGDVSYDD